MTIRLNLLAEDQAAEELRRRDPVKRAIWVAAMLTSVMLLWAVWLQARAFMSSRALGKLEKQIAARSAEFQEVLDIQQNASDVDTKLNALRQLALNRYLCGTMLNALQQCTVDNIQLSRLHVEQNYAVTEATKPKTLETGRVMPAKPATSTEKILLALDGKDYSPNPEKSEAVISFKAKLADHPYFQSMLGKTNEVRLTALSPPQAVHETRSYVQFTLECRYPEKTR